MKIFKIVLIVLTTLFLNSATCLSMDGNNDSTQKKEETVTLVIKPVNYNTFRDLFNSKKYDLIAYATDTESISILDEVDLGTEEDSISDNEKIIVPIKNNSYLDQRLSLKIVTKAMHCLKKIALTPIKKLCKYKPFRNKVAFYSCFIFTIGLVTTLLCIIIYDYTHCPADKPLQCYDLYGKSVCECGNITSIE